MSARAFNMSVGPEHPDYVPPEPGTPEHRRIYLGYLAMVVGMFMAILDIQIVASSISEIQAGVSASADEVAWIQTSYLIAEVIGIAASALWNRAFGMRRLFVISALGFTLSSLLCATAWDLPSLIVFRSMQGFMGAAMLPTTMAAAFSLFGPNRSVLQQVMIAMVATLAPATGPTLGGWVTESFGWHWLFLINLAPGLFVAWAVWRLIPGGAPNLDVLRRLDVLGLISMAVFLGSFEWVFEEGPAAGWFEDEHLLQWAFICAIAALVFFWRSLTHDNPIVNLRVFADRNFSVNALMVTIVGFGLYGTVYLMPLFLGQLRDLNALQIGWIMSVGGGAMFLGGPLSGVLIRRIDPRYVLVAGLIFTSAGLYWNHFLTLESDWNELFWPQVLRGAGIIMCMVPVNFLALGTLPPHQLANASSLITVCRNIGGAVGLAGLNTLRLNYDNLHTQELAARMNPAQPGVQAYLAEAESRLRMLGEPDPAAQALAQLGARIRLESGVMTFANLFFAMSVCFALMLLLVPLIARPKRLAGGAPLPPRKPVLIFDRTPKP